MKNCINKIILMLKSNYRFIMLKFLWKFYINLDLYCDWVLINNFFASLIVLLLFININNAIANLLSTFIVHFLIKITFD